MNTQTKLAITAILVVIPLSSIAVYGTNFEQDFSANSNSKLQAMTSFYVLQEFAEKIGQDKVDVSLLVPEGVEPHDWEPTIKDVQKMQAADLIIINGIGFENWVHKLDKMSNHVTIVDTSNGISIKLFDDDMEHGDEHGDEHHDSGDPHIWLNPVYAKIQVQNIATAFSNLDNQNQKFYQSNANQYISELESLDSKIRDELKSCNSDFIAFHDAFSYFADEYGLTQHTITSSNISHGEVTAKTLQEVISTAKKFNIKVIFSEKNIDSKTTNIIANEIGGKVLVLSPLEVFSGDSYISTMTQNLENLKEALC
ncbi:metal ABC transporter solute-binding protein, Zn/Mn family [Nitrosopumilus sp. S4]